MSGASVILAKIFIYYLLVEFYSLHFNEFIVYSLASFKEYTGNCKDRICQLNQSDFVINIFAVMRVIYLHSISTD